MENGAIWPAGNPAMIDTKNYVSYAYYYLDGMKLS